MFSEIDLNNFLWQIGAFYDRSKSQLAEMEINLWNIFEFQQVSDAMSFSFSQNCQLLRETALISIFYV